MSIGGLSVLQIGLILAGIALVGFGLWASSKTYRWVPCNVVARRRELSPYLLGGVVTCVGVGLVTYQFVVWPWQRLAMLVIGLVLVLSALKIVRVELGYAFHRGARGILMLVLMAMVLGGGIGATVATIV